MNWTEANQLGDLEALEEHFQELDQHIQDQTMTDDKELIARLRDEHVSASRTEAADRIEALTKEREELHDRITAMETGDWSEVRLVRFENGQFDLTAGPIPAIAEYLAQMMEDGKGEYFNFMEVQINHKSAGPMVLSLQRKHGKTPNELRKAAEAKLAKAVKALRFYAWENEMRLPSDGPWGAGSTDFGKVARATLVEIKGGNDAESNL